jgi:uncharacterized membrane protein
MSDLRDPETPKKDHPQPSHNHFWAHIRNYLLAGILVTGPIGITIYLTWVIVDFIDQKVAQLIPEVYLKKMNDIVPFSVPGIGLIIALLIFILIGFLTANLFGQAFVKLSERIFEKMPFVRGFYSATKQVFETLFSKQSSAFRQVLLVTFPTKGSYALGFLTGSSVSEIESVADGEMLNVFVPTTPNPTSGFLLFVPRNEAIVLKMSVEDGLKLVISGGIISPEDKEKL